MALADAEGFDDERVLGTRSGWYKRSQPFVKVYVGLDMSGEPSLKVLEKETSIKFSFVSTY